MNATELMIGDWVRIVKEYGNTQDEIIKVDALDLCRISRGDYEVEPIPLTAEILNANFPDVRNGVFWGWNDYKSTEQEIWFEIRIEIDTDESLIRNIRYVHELQHALRLCGIKKEVEL